ncbi:Glutamyl-tRNA(Gln) amidotransferase subunit C [bacterium HR19]|nr:Glutamyl-tRNA(Gln) amidotransferase subunit C [bacterium HR19]
MVEFDFENILKLSMIDIPKEKKKFFREQIEQIIDFFNIINELKLEEVEPTQWKFEESQRLREDIPESFGNAKEIIEGFPKKRDRFAVVPQVIESS